MSFLLWVEALLLFLAAVLTGLGASGVASTVVFGGVPELWIRVIFGIFSAGFLAGSSLCLALWAGRIERHRPLRLPGPRGLVLITPQTVTQLAQALLAQELEETPFRIRLRSRRDGLFIRVFLRLPEAARIPELAAHLQELLTAEVSQRTGLKVHEVEVVVHGTSRRV
jgi:hypothetical protein